MMKNIHTALIFSFLLPIFAAIAGELNEAESDGVIIVYKKGASERQRADVRRKWGGRIKQAMRTRLGNAHIMSVENRERLKQRIVELRSDPDVEWAQPNYIYKISAVPNDPLYSQQWSLSNTGQTIVSTPSNPYVHTPVTTSNPGSAGLDLGLERAWNTITDCSSTLVAVVDTGINYNHQDIAPNLWDGGAAYPHHGFNFVTNTTDPLDDNGHGTHVAGTIGAVGNNGYKGTGVCWKARMMAVKVAGADGSATTANMSAGVQFAVDNGAKVINISMAAILSQADGDRFFGSALQEAEARGVLVIAAGGNNGAIIDGYSLTIYPCASSSTSICVAALDQNFQMANFSNYGSTSVDIGAPGVNVVAPWIPLTGSSTDRMTAISGTSMATPNVAGIAAMVLSANPLYRAADVIEAILKSGRATASMQGRTKTGKAVHAEAALAYIKVPSGLRAR